MKNIILSNNVVYQVIRDELQHLGIPKKYNGFKFVCDLCFFILTKDVPNTYSTSTIILVAQANQTNYCNVERNIRHMLNKTCSTNTILAEYLKNLNIKRPTTKKILQQIILYLQKVI